MNKGNIFTRFLSTVKNLGSRSISYISSIYSDIKYRVRGIYKRSLTSFSDLVSQFALTLRSQFKKDIRKPYVINKPSY